MGKHEGDNVKKGKGDEKEGKRSSGAKTRKEKLVEKAAKSKQKPKRTGIKYI